MNTEHLCECDRKDVEELICCLKQNPEDREEIERAIAEILANEPISVTRLV